MDDHEIAVRLERLGSPNKNRRYEACEELRVAPYLPRAAITALEQASNDSDPGFADAARRALLAHRQDEAAPNSTPESSSLAPPPKETPVSTRKKISGYLLFAAILLAFFGILGAPMELACRRVALRGPVDCVRQTHLLWIIPLPGQRIADVRGAQVGESSGYEGGPTYRVELLTANGSVPLTNGYTSGRYAKDEVAGRVNALARGAAPGALAVTEPGLLSLENVACLLVWLPFAIIGNYLWGKIKSAFGGAGENTAERSAQDPYRFIGSHRLTVPCPYCGKSIPQDAIDCFHCGREVYAALHKT